ncbi:MAG: histidinol-phosphate transaminase [archaeon]|jgi:histidinol-phosphate aminotransferase
MISPKQTVIELETYSPPTSGRENMLRLDFNENTVGCSPKVLLALQKINTNKISVYPEYGDFIEKLSIKLGVSSDEVVLTNGTDEAINQVMQTFVEKGEEVIIPVPTFAMFKFYATLAGAKVREVLYNLDLSFPFEQVMNSISSKTKVVVIVNPNNPTGSSISEIKILKILKKAKANDSLVLIDEAYFEFYGKSSIELISQFDNLIITRTFSKAYGLAGLRLGCIISNKEIIANIRKSISPYSVNTVALICASAAIEDKNFVQEYVNQVIENRAIVSKKLSEFGVKVFPSSANFLIGDFGERCNVVYSKLKERGILVRNRTDDPLLKGCLRIGIGTKEQCEQLLKGIREILFERNLIV